MLLAHCRDAVGILLGCCWDSVGMLLGCCRDAVGILLGCCWDADRMLLGCFGKSNIPPQISNYLTYVVGTLPGSCQEIKHSSTNFKLSNLCCWHTVGMLSGFCWDAVGMLLGFCWDVVGMLTGCCWDALGNQTFHHKFQII